MSDYEIKRLAQQEEALASGYRSYYSGTMSESEVERLLRLEATVTETRRSQAIVKSILADKSFKTAAPTLLPNNASDAHTASPPDEASATVTVDAKSPKEPVVHLNEKRTLTNLISELMESIEKDNAIYDKALMDMRSEHEKSIASRTAMIVNAKSRLQHLKNVSAELNSA